MPAAYFEDSPGPPQPWGAPGDPQAVPPPTREPMFNAPWPALLVSVLIVGGYGVQSLLPEALVNAFAFVPGDLTHGRWWTVVTAVFLHGNWAHALMNGAFALAFATPVARLFGDRAQGAAAFFGFYVLTGVVGNLGFAALHPQEMAAVVGASGAVSGLMGAAARLIAGRGQIGGIFAPATLSFGAALLVVNLMIALFGSSLVPGAGGSGVAWEAHLAGFVAGVLLIRPFAWLAWRT